MDSRDKQRIIRIKKYCDRIQEYILRFGKDPDAFMKDFAFSDGISMCILQIGELAKGLSDQYCMVTNEIIPWKLITGMRNWIAHAYGEMDKAQIWETAVNDIPKLQEFCDRELNKEKRRSPCPPHR